MRALQHRPSEETPEPEHAELVPPQGGEGPVYTNNVRITGQGGRSALLEIAAFMCCRLPAQRYGRKRRIGLASSPSLDFGFYGPTVTPGSHCCPFDSVPKNGRYRASADYGAVHFH